MTSLWFLPVFVAIYMSAWFLISLKVKRKDVVDIAWAAGFVFLTWVALSFRELPLDSRSYWLLFVVTLWGLRLSLHTFRRNLSKEEDWRYHRWHEIKSYWYPFFSFIQVFIFQGALLMIIALPVVYGLCLIALPLFSINYFGIVLMIAGFILEAVADSQRYRFLRQPGNKNRLITSGLWRYSRHPNYFWDIVFWWGVYFLVFGAPKSWMLIISPLTVTYIFLFVSGLPMESRYRNRPDFQEYKRTTSALIPWFPKNKKSVFSDK